MLVVSGCVVAGWVVVAGCVVVAGVCCWLCYWLLFCCSGCCYCFVLRTSFMIISVEYFYNNFNNYSKKEIFLINYKPEIEIKSNRNLRES